MTTLLLSGWTQPTDALAHLVEDALLFDYSDYPTPEAAIAAIAQLRPTHAIGWSMGGQLALRAIAAGALAPKHLTLIAAPMQFVAAASPIPNPQFPIPPAMDPLTYQLFRESYAKDPARTKTRFHGLVAKGDRDQKRVMGLLGHHPQVEETSRWLPWLENLAAYRLAEEGLAAAPPTLIIHGTHDAIVPHAQSEHLTRWLPRAELRTWEGVGHAPHFHDAARLRAEIAAHRAQHGVD